MYIAAPELMDVVGRRRRRRALLPQPLHPAHAARPCRRALWQPGHVTQYQLPPVVLERLAAVSHSFGLRVVEHRVLPRGGEIAVPSAPEQATPDPPRLQYILHLLNQPLPWRHHRKVGDFIVVVVLVRGLVRSLVGGFCFGANNTRGGVVVCGVGALAPDHARTCLPCLPIYGIFPKCQRFVSV